MRLKKIAASLASVCKSGLGPIIINRASGHKRFSCCIYRGIVERTVALRYINGNTDIATYIITAKQSSVFGALVVSYVYVV